MIEEGVEYANSILDLLATNSFDKGDNFTVVAQPFLINQRLPTDKVGQLPVLLSEVATHFCYLTIQIFLTLT